jgi:hypothetical protein
MQNISNAAVTNPTIDRSLASNNISGGFAIDNTASHTVCNRCIAAGNTNRGINNVTASSVFIDCRTQHAATTINPAYNLNGVGDLLSGATEIIIS